MNNKHLVNIAIAHIKEEDKAHGIGDIKKRLYKDIDGIHLDVNKIKADIITVGKDTEDLSSSLGDMAFEDKVESAKLGSTIISGGYIRTSLIKTDDLIVGDNIHMGPNAKISWENLEQEIVDGIDEGKMRWLGSMDNFPSNPERNDMFYHSGHGKSYVWAGTQWYVVAVDGSIGPQGPKGDKGDRGTDGSYYAPSYLRSTYINGAEVRSPTITGNDGRFAGNVFVGVGTSNNVAGISGEGTSASSVRFWAGDANKLTAPFRVTQGGSVYMTKANIETDSVDGKYIKMSGSRIDGGDHARGISYLIGTANYTGASRAGLFRSTGYSSSNSSLATRSMDVGNNSILASGSNFILAGNSGVIVTKNASVSDHTLTIPNSSTMYVKGNLTVTGELWVNGVKIG